MDFTFIAKIPLAQQIEDKFIELIELGVFKEEEKLPSLRELAFDLGVNRNTVVKVFDRLEKKNYIYSLDKKGYYICSDKKKKGESDKFNDVDMILKNIMEKYQLDENQLIERLDNIKKGTQDDSSK